MAQQHNGTIRYVSTSKRFGFITPLVSGKPDVFFSFDQLRGHAARSPRIGEKVVYEVSMGKCGPVATTVYNMADPLACEDYANDLEILKRLEAAKQTVQEGQRAFREALYERNRQWRAAHALSSRNQVPS